MTEFLDALHFGFRRRLPMLRQTEAAECGLACLTMVANYHGHIVDIATLRRRFSISIKGTNLRHLIEFGNGLNLTARPLRLALLHKSCGNQG